MFNELPKTPMSTKPALMSDKKNKVKICLVRDFFLIDKYINKAATITYNFKIKEPSNILYFYSSEIK